MTAEESGSVEVPSAERAEENLWLTYLNYDSSVQQAVRRLGALSQENVELFRTLLLKERKRSRFADYEAESIRQLQGEAFVGDEALQRALIVLNAEDPRYGAELKRRVAAEGKPQVLDQLVAEIRGDRPRKLEVVAAPAETAVESAATEQTEVAPPVEAEAAAPEPAVEPVSEPVAEEKLEQAPEPEPVAPPAKAEAPGREAEIVPLRAAAPRPVFREEETRGNWKWPVAIGAVLLIGAAGAFLIAHGRKEPSSQVVAAAKLQAAASATAAAEAVAPENPADKEAAAPSSEQAPQSDAAAQEDKSEPDKAEPDKTASASPPLRPATTQPDAAPPAQADASAPQAPADAAPSDVSSTPVAGSKYKVVRGDMLSDIAMKVYGDAHKWRLIQAANPGLRRKPDYILVDQVIEIPVEKK